MHSYTLRDLLAAKFNQFPVAIADAFPSVLFGRMLALACRLGFFEALSKGPCNATDVARALTLDPKSSELILSSLAAAKYLKKKGNAYSLAPAATKWLLQSSPQYIGNFLAYIELLHAHWMSLEETIRDGIPSATYIETFGPREWDIYTLGMMDLANLLLPRVLPKITLPASAGRLLDLAGSHGLYTIRLCELHPGITATITDFPEVLRTTKSIIQKHHLEDRITLSPCDIRTAVFEKEQYDVVLAFNIIHGFSEETNQKLFRTIGSTLRPGGVLYILDQLRSERGTGINRMLPLMVGLNLLNEVGGNAYTIDEITTWCQASGLARVKEFRLSLPGVSLVRTVKV